MERNEMSWTPIRDTMPRARKIYRCRICNEEILTGERHVARSGFDIKPITFRMHIECEKLTQYWDQGDWESTAAGDTERPTE